MKFVHDRCAIKEICVLIKLCILVQNKKMYNKILVGYFKPSISHITLKNVPCNIKYH